MVALVALRDNEGHIFDPKHSIRGLFVAMHASVAPTWFWIKLTVRGALYTTPCNMQTRIEPQLFRVLLRLAYSGQLPVWPSTRHP